MMMSPDTDTIRYAAAALLDLLPADAAVGTLRRVNPGGRVQRGPCRHAPAGGPRAGAPVPAVRGGIVSRSALFERLGRSSFRWTDAGPGSATIACSPTCSSCSYGILSRANCPRCTPGPPDGTPGTGTPPRGSVTPRRRRTGAWPHACCRTTGSTLIFAGRPPPRASSLPPSRQCCRGRRGAHRDDGGGRTGPGISGGGRTAACAGHPAVRVGTREPPRTPRGGAHGPAAVPGPAAWGPACSS